MIELKNVCYSYSGINALNNINLNINKGEAVSLIGSNGSGKSTLLKLINGIILPDSGSYKFCGDEITQKKLKDTKFSKRFHQKIGFVFQNPEVQLFCADVYDEVAFGPRQMGMDESQVEQRVNDCLNLLNIGDFKDRQPYHLSGGEQRKVAIASVLALNPEVLVLDEPMNGLDLKTQKWLVDFLATMSKAGKTLILSTHNLDLVQEISKRSILFDEDHTIIADMKTKELLEDIELLKRVNIVNEHYHIHAKNENVHYHSL